MSARGFLKDSAYSLAARLWMALARGACIVAISRALGPSDYGAYALVLNTFVVAVLIGTLGLEQANTYSAGKYPERLPLLFRNALWSSGLLGLATVLLFVPVARLCQDRLFDARSVRLIWESMFFVPIVILQNQLSGLVVGSAWFRYYAKSEACKWTLYLGLSLALLLVHRLTVRSALLAFYAALAASAGLHAVVLGYHCRKRPAVAGESSLHLARQSLAYGWKAFSASAVNLLNFRFDLYLVKYFRTPGEVGTYSLGMNLAEVLLYCARSINLVLFARVSSDQRRSSSLTPVVSRFLVTGITAAVLVILACKDGIILSLFGDKFATCSNVVTLLLPGIVAQSLTLLLVGDLLGKEELGVVLRSGLTCFVVMVGLDLWWIPAWGILGAAAASAIAYGAQCAYLLAYHSAARRQDLSCYLLLQRADLEMVRGRLSGAWRGARA